MSLLRAAVLVLLSPLALAQEAVVIFTERSEPPRKVAATALPEIKSEVAAVWAWSESVPPRRTDVGGVSRELKRAAEGKLEVRVDRQRLPKETRLRLMAAPQQAWEEVPEHFLPTWTVLAGGSVQLPIDRGVTWRVRLTGAGFGTWWTDVPPGRGTVVLAPIEASDRAIRLETESGRALVNARLSILDEAVQRGNFSKLADYRSDQSGRVVLPALPDAAPVTLIGSTHDRAPRVLTARPSTLPDRMVIPAGAVVRGRVVDRDGKPIANASVGVRTWLAETLPVPLLRSSNTKADGLGEVTALPAGRAEWRATAPGYAPASRPLRLAIDSAIDLGTIVLEPAVTIAVRVRDDRGEPVRASVAVNDGAAVAANAKGEATLPVIPSQPFEIAAAAPLHRRAKREVRPPFPAVVEIELTRAFRVTGRMVDANGAPVPQVSIRARQGSSFENHEADPDGRFDLALEPGVDHELEMLAPTIAVVKVDVAAGSPGETRDLGDMTAATGLVVTGRLLRSSDRTPVAGARIWLPRPSEAGALMAWAFRDLLQTESGPDGTFELRGLPASPFTMRIEAPSLAPARQRVTPDAGAARVDVGEIALAAGTTVTVVLDGNSGEDATAHIDAGGSGMPMDLLSAPFTNGRAIVPAVPSGAVTVSATRGKETLCRQQATVPANVSEIQIVCRARMVRIEGSVMIGGRSAALGTVVFVPPLDADVATGILNRAAAPIGSSRCSRPAPDVTRPRWDTTGASRFRESCPAYGKCSGCRSAEARSRHGASTFPRRMSIRWCCSIRECRCAEPSSTRSGVRSRARTFGRCAARRSRVLLPTARSCWPDLQPGHGRCRRATASAPAACWRSKYPRIDGPIRSSSWSKSPRTRCAHASPRAPCSSSRPTPVRCALRARTQTASPSCASNSRCRGASASRPRPAGRSSSEHGYRSTSRWATASRWSPAPPARCTSAAKSGAGV
jgi:protocatechuate 3,4-dioxygenase beta subunit